MKKCFTLLILLLFILSMPVKGLDIAAEIDGEERSVPLLVVDETGRGIKVLTAQDFSVTINHLPVENFRLIPRDIQKSPVEIENRVPLETLFLVFDNALSSSSLMEESRLVAAEIVQAAPASAHFILMTIDGFQGLGYLGEFQNTPQEREVVFAELAHNLAGPSSYAPDSKYSEYSEALYKQSCLRFVKGIESLYYCSHAIKAKGRQMSIYLFSEGLSRGLHYFSDRQEGLVFFTHYLKKIAAYLSCSGAFITIINADGSKEERDSTNDNFDLQRTLVDMLDCRYLHGSSSEIINHLRQQQPGFYSLIIPTHSIEKTQTPNRKNLYYLSIQASLPEKLLFYTANTLLIPDSLKNSSEEGRDTVLLNLLYCHPFYSQRFDWKKLTLQNTNSQKKKRDVVFSLPSECKNSEMEWSQFWVIPTKSVVNVEHDTFTLNSPFIKLKLESIDDIFPGLAILDRQHETVFIYGAEPVDTTLPIFFFSPSSLLLAMPDSVALEVRRLEKDQTVDNEKMEKGLQAKEGDFFQSDNASAKEILAMTLRGAAGYCHRLKESALHFLCRETVDTAIKAKNDEYQHQQFFFEYQLISVNNKIKEQRQYKSNTQETPPDILLKNKVPFISQRVFFGPIALLEASCQKYYQYRFLGHQRDKNTGIKCVVIEAIPKPEYQQQVSTNSFSFGKSTVYGKIWIDPRDYSVIRIDASPHSILREEDIKNLEKRFHGKVDFLIQAEFNYNRRGLRFPGKIVFIERYSRYLSNLMYSRGKLTRQSLMSPYKNYWDRSLTTYTYDGYRFFSVSTDVSYSDTPYPEVPPQQQQ